jgi:long-chain acyl-CoA synthetase
MARTLTELYFGALERFGTRPVVFRAKRDGQWSELSYQQLADKVQDLSLGLLELGVRPGDRVAILSENRPEWAIADYACLAARCTDVPIYPTLPAKQVEYTLPRHRRVPLVPAVVAHLRADVRPLLDVPRRRGDQLR